MSRYYWCFFCERAFDPKKSYEGEVAAPGLLGGFSFPLCGVESDQTLDWESFIFGVASGNNYPPEPEEGEYYPLYPVK